MDDATEQNLLVTRADGWTENEAGDVAVVMTVQPHGKDEDGNYVFSYAPTMINDPIKVVWSPDHPLALFPMIVANRIVQRKYARMPKPQEIAAYEAMAAQAATGAAPATTSEPVPPVPPAGGSAPVVAPTEPVATQPAPEAATTAAATETTEANEAATQATSSQEAPVDPETLVTKVDDRKWTVEGIEEPFATKREALEAAANVIGGEPSQDDGNSGAVA